MNPIKNKKNLESSVEEIRNIAYRYIEKYSPSKQQLRTYLFKKLITKSQKTANKREIFNLIDSVILTLTFRFHFYRLLSLSTFYTCLKVKVKI